MIRSKNENYKGDKKVFRFFFGPKKGTKEKKKVNKVHRMT